jgi:hypothetical protein
MLVVDNTLADWWAGNSRQNAYGATALISSPLNPLILITDTGQSNWVSTLHQHNDLKDWIQSGWRYYEYYTEDVPAQYWEFCDNCWDPGFIHDHLNYGFHNWDTTVDYWVIWDENERWCAYSGPGTTIQRHCQPNLHAAPILIVAKSEVHDSPLNPLDTTFSDVRYKAADVIWRLFDQNRFTSDFPYGVEVYANYHYRTHRLSTYDIYLPIVIK